MEVGCWESLKYRWRTQGPERLGRRGVVLFTGSLLVYLHLTYETSHVYYG